MINLMPYELKRQTKAARMNVIVLRYIFILIIAISFLSAAFYVTYIVVNEHVANENEVVIPSNTVLQSQAASYRSKLAIVASIMNQQSSYAEAMSKIGSALPAGTVLNSLTLDDNSFNIPTTLSIAATSEALEPSIKAMFQRTANISNYELVSSKVETSPKDSKYPVTITIRVTLNRGTQQ
ncbi:hypothetical protein HGB25_01765 [Candidatus Saccharibacteria bacterium]|nr:hypothetical protein [Candidatus Saccharibacteria bacterium]